MKIRLLPIITAAALTPSMGFALGVRLLDQDAAATARADAFVATADNPSAIYYNPAGITQLDNLTARLGVYSVNLDVDYYPEKGGDSFDAHHKWSFVPQSFYTMRPKDWPFTFGLGFYSPFGLEMKWPENGPFRQITTYGKLETITANPVIALQVTRTLSVAFGATINYGELDLRQGILGPEFGGGDQFRFKGSGLSGGFNAGILWKPTAQHSFGITYRSGVSIDFEGHTKAILSDKERHAAHAGNQQVAAARAKVDAIEQQINSAPLPPAIKAQLIAKAEAQFAAGLAAAGVPPGGFVEDLGPMQEADAKFRMPQVVTFGYSFRPTPQWNLEVDADYTDWDSLNTVKLHQKDGQTFDLPFNWRSSWIFEFGATRKFDNGFRLSGGYGYAQNSVPNESFQPSVPDSNHHFFSLGIGQSMSNKIDWDVAYQLTYGPKRTIDNDTLADGRYRFISHAITFSVGYHF